MMPCVNNPGTPNATVVVSVHNGEKYVKACIESLIAQNLQPEAIIVADDGSTDGTVQALSPYRKESRVQVVVLPRNLGVPAARNAGVAHSRSEIIVFIDADAVAPPEWLGELVAPFSDPSVVCTGGPDRAPPNDRVFAQAVDHSLRSLIASGRLRRQNPFAAYSPGGCNMAVRGEAFVAAGGFDERLDRRGEEKELVQRLRRGGKRVIYCDRAQVWHHRRPSPPRFWRQIYLSGRARVDILRLSPDALAWPHLAPALLVVMLSTAALACLVPGGCGSVPGLLLGTYILALLADALVAATGFRSAGIAVLVPLTTAMVHWGYGIGLLVGGLRWVAGRPVGSGAVAGSHKSYDG